MFRFLTLLATCILWSASSHGARIELVHNGVINKKGHIISGQATICPKDLKQEHFSVLCRFDARVSSVAFFVNGILLRLTSHPPFLLTDHRGNAFKPWKGYPPLAVIHCASNTGDSVDAVIKFSCPGTQKKLDADDARIEREMGQLGPIQMTDESRLIATRRLELGPEKMTSAMTTASSAITIAYSEKHAGVTLAALQSPANENRAPPLEHSTPPIPSHTPVPLVEISTTSMLPQTSIPASKTHKRRVVTIVEASTTPSPFEESTLTPVPAANAFALESPDVSPLKEITEQSQQRKETPAPLVGTPLQNSVNDAHVNIVLKLFRSRR